MAFGPGGKASRWDSKRRKVVLFHPVEGVGAPRLFGFGYRDLAAFCGVKEATIRTAVSKGLLDPTSFDSIFEYASPRR